MAETYFIAVDGGGTKTEFVLFTDNGEIKQRLVLGGSNPNLCGMDHACHMLQTGIDALCAAEKKVAGIYCGLSGYLSGENGKKISKFLTSAYPDVPIDCNGDILNVAASADAGEQCIVAICGTGSNVCAINGEEIHRVGGWGYLFDCNGSGYDIGRDGITAALAEHDGIGEKTLITNLIEEKLGMNIWEGISRFYAEPPSFVASFSYEVFNAYAKNDPVAGKILEKNMKGLAEKINFAAENYPCGSTVVISGGLTAKWDVLSEFMLKYLDTGINITIPKLPQIYGACMLCLKKHKVSVSGFSARFSDNYNRLSYAEAPAQAGMDV